MVRRLIIFCIVSLGIIAALLLALHLRPVRTSLASWAAGRLRDAGVEASFQTVSYNLFALSFTARDVVLAARGSEATPFLRADQLSVTLPWSVTRGRAAARAIRVTNLQLDFHRRADGSWNLPRGQRSQSASLDRFEVETLLVSNASVRYRDESADVAVVADGITIDLRPRSPGISAGPLVIDHGPRIRVADRESVASHAAGRLTFDGTRVSIEGFDYRAPEGHFRAEGQFDSVFFRPRSAVEMAGNLSLARLSPWLGLEPNADGTISIRASLAGLLAEPEVHVRLDGKNTSWRHLENVSLRMGARVNGSGVTVEEAIVGLGDGMFVARGRVPVDGSTGTVHGDWRGLSLGDLIPQDLALPIAGTLEGTVDIEWADRTLRGLNITAENRAVPTDRGQSTLSVQGQSSLRIADGKWQLVHDHEIARSAHLAGMLGGRLSPEAFGRSTLTGTGEVGIEELRSVVASLRHAKIALPGWMDELNGTADASLQVEGSLESPRVTGTGRVQELEWKEIGPGEATFRLAADSRGLTIEALDALVGANRVSGTASMQFESDTLEGSARIDLKELGKLVPGVKDPWQPSGILTADVEIGGALSSPTLTGTFQGQTITMASQNMGTVTGRLGYADNQVSVTELEVQQAAGGRLSASGTFATSTGAFSVTVRGNDFGVTPVGEGGSILPVDAAMAIDFVGQGTLEHPRGEGRLTFGRLSWRDLPLGPAEATVELSEAGVHVDSRLPELNTRVGGTVQLTAPWVFDLAADVVDADLSALAARRLITPSPFLADLDGHASFTATGTGNFESPENSRVDVALRTLEIQKQKSALRLVRPTTLHYERTRIAADDLELQTGETVVRVAGSLGESRPGLQIQLAGNLRDIEAWASAFRAEDRLSMQGRVDGVIRVSGSVDRPDLTGQLAIAGKTVQFGDFPPLEDVSFRAQLSESVIVASEIGARWQGARLSGRATVPLLLFDRWLPSGIVATRAEPPDGGGLSLRVDDLTTAALGPFVTNVPERLEGTLSAVLDLRARSLGLESLTGSLVVERLAGNIAGVALTQTVPTRFEVTNGRVRIADWIWDASGSRLTVSGEGSLVTRELDVALIGLVDLRMVGGFVRGMTTAGSTEIGLRFTGRVDAPEIAGTLFVQDGELQSIDPQVVLDAVGGRIVLEGGRLRLVDVTGSVNGGPFTLTGELRHEAFTITSGQFDFSGRQVALNVPQGFRTEVDAALVLSFSEESPRLTGRATIQRGAYREPLSLAAGLVGAARRRRVTTGRPEVTWLDQLGLNIAISSAEDLIVDNNYGRLDLALDVRLVGSAGRPAIVGRAEVREGGVLYLGGRTYQVESGVIDFADQNEIRPDLNIIARTRVSGVDITLTITGTPETLQGELSSSNPEYSQSDLASLLLTGRTSSEIGGAETTIAREQLIALLSGEVLGFAAQAVGLDTIRLDRGAGVEEMRTEPSLVAGEADPSSRLTLSKNFARYAEVVLSQDLQESGDFTWIFGVTPRRGLEVRAVSRDDQSRSYEIRHDVSFGQPAGASSPTRRVRTDEGEERISKVQFAGDPGVPIRELEALLKLRAGERFDFYQWQSDRERLRRFYLDRSYFEARVTARRQKPEEGMETILEYVIRPGPHTNLRIVGYPLPDGVRRDLETLWGNAVFEEVFFTDAERRVRSFLIGEGYVGAVVKVSRVNPSTEGEKSIEVAIAEGVRSRSREIAFSGNEVVPTRRLEALVRERDLELSAWVEPVLLDRAVRDLYEEDGLLNVTVVVGKPIVAEDRAVLPVRIIEGRQFHVTDIVISGVARLPEADVRKALGLEPEHPYAWQAVETGRRAVEAAYRRQGFNAVRTDVQEEIDRDRAEVRFTLNVNEGVQQVLQTVELEGAEGLRPNGLSRALSLETGEPADLSGWQQARRRLLETGLFRSVDIQAVPIETVAPVVQGTEPVAARVTLHRWPFWRLRYGFEVGDELAPLGDSRVFGPGFTADLQRRTIWGLPINVGTSFRATRDERIGRVFLSAPNFFTLPLSSTLFVSRSREDIKESGFLAFLTDKTTVTAEQRFRRGRNVQFSYGYQYERNHTFAPNANPDDPLRVDFFVREARLTSTGLLDRRDDPFDATRGLMHSSTFEYGPEVLGSDLRFIKYFGQQLYFRPMKGIVSASAIRFGVGRGLGGQELILSERFFAGGASTVRGYREDSLGETDFLGFSLGGQGLLIFNQEARFPIYRWLRGVGFFDAGNVFHKASDLSFELETSVGLGLRLATPVGMFRVDFGVPLSSDNGRQTPRWHFSLGQMF